MASPVLDLTIYNATELQEMLVTAKAEYLRRMTSGRVTQGSSAAQTYGMTVMSVDDLIRLMNGLGSALGLTNETVTASPNFSGRSCQWGGYPYSP